MQISPYTPGTLARTVPGREEQLHAIKAVLGRIATFGEFAGRIRVDVGPRGLGKTSLLRRGQELAVEAGLETVFVTAGDGSMLAALSDAIGGLDNSRSSPLTGLVSEVKAKLGIGPAGVEVTFKPQASRGTSASGAFKKLVRTAAQRARTFDKRGLAIFLDELQAADLDSLRTLAYSWQELQAEAPDVPAAVFAAGLSHTPDVVVKAASFAERMAFRPMDRLDDGAVRAALTEPAAALGVTWDQNLLAHVVELTQGYPYYVQLYGDELWRAAGGPDPGAHLSAALLGRAQRGVDTELAGLFRGRWHTASPRERQVLSAMAVVGRDRVRRAEIAAALGVDSNALSMVRRSLVDKGLVEVPARGYLAFTLPGFADYLRDLSDDPPR